MNFETLKSYRIEDVEIKLQIITGLASENDETEHFCVLISDLHSCFNSVHFDSLEDADACFVTFLKMKTF